MRKRLNVKESQVSEILWNIGAEMIDMTMINGLMKLIQDTTI